MRGQLGILVGGMVLSGILFPAEEVAAGHYSRCYSYASPAYVAPVYAPAYVTYTPYARPYRPVYRAPVVRYRSHYKPYYYARRHHHHGQHRYYRYRGHNRRGFGFNVYGGRGYHGRRYGGVSFRID